MASPPRQTSRPRRGRLSVQMERAMGDRQRAVRSDRVHRVLALLRDDSLMTAAGLSLTGDQDGITLECGFADLVWEEPEVRYRVNQLADRGIRVELVAHETEVAGRRFSRPQLVVRFTQEPE